MVITEILMVGVGGFCGAVIRFLLSGKLDRCRTLPIGTLVVNLIGSFFIGFILGIGLPKLWTLFFVSGFAGALTTFSTVQKEIIEQFQSGRQKEAIIYLLLTYGSGIVVAFIGYLIGR